MGEDKNIIVQNMSQSGAGDPAGASDRGADEKNGDGSDEDDEMLLRSRTSSSRGVVQPSSTAAVSTSEAATGRYVYYIRSRTSNRGVVQPSSTAAVSSTAGIEATGR
eukprot:sb/3477679/